LGGIPAGADVSTLAVDAGPGRMYSIVFALTSSAGAAATALSRPPRRKSATATRAMTEGTVQLDASCSVTRGDTQRSRLSGSAFGVLTYHERSQRLRLYDRRPRLRHAATCGIRDPPPSALSQLCCRSNTTCRFSRASHTRWRCQTRGRSAGRYATQFQDLVTPVGMVRSHQAELAISQDAVLATNRCSRFGCRRARPQRVSTARRTLS